MLSGDASEIEEERRLCYVAITRAMRRLKITAAKSRVRNGEIIYSGLSRFVKELPQGIVSDEEEEAEEKDFFGSRRRETFSERRAAVKSVTEPAPKAAPKPAPKADFGKSFRVERTSSLSYGVGDRVRNVRFGEGTVLEIVDGKRDYEVTVDFDNFGERRMFASFAKLQRVE